MSGGRQGCGNFGPGGAHYPVVRWTLAVTLGLSLTAHAGVAAYLLVPHRHAKTAEPPADPAPAFAGETFELPAPETTEAPLAQASPSPETNGAPADVEISDAPAHPTPHGRRTAPRTSREGRPSGGKAEGTKDAVEGGTSNGGLYGAVGDRSAQDMKSAFLRAFVLTASASPEWSKAPLGPIGEAVVTITLDESGHITDFAIGGAPSSLLRKGLESAMQLVKNRPFTSKGKITRLHFSASIHEDATGVFGVDANGSFTLPIGRKVELRPLK